jgi:hypothetical protein
MSITYIDHDIIEKVMSSQGRLANVVVIVAVPQTVGMWAV